MLGFTSMYDSWWFISLLFIFTANLIVCSIERLPKVWKLIKEPIKPLPVETFKGMPINREITLKKGLKESEVRNTIDTTLKKLGFKRILKSEDELQFYAEKGRYSRFGVYITHFSMILIFIGALVGIFFGFQAYVNIMEGTSTKTVYSRADGSEIPLPFEIKVHDFHTDFWEGTDRPKEFRSWVTIYEDGKPAKGLENFVVAVNRPLKHRGVIFYQSSYGFSPSMDSLFKFIVTSNDDKRQDVQLKFGEAFTIPGTNIMGKVADFSPALGIDESGRLFTYAEMMNNPAVFVEFTENGKPKYNQWILNRYPQTWRVPDGMVEFKDLWGSQYTGLQVRKDPGVWLVYLGCLIMTIGFYMAFFMSHRRIWGRLTKDSIIIAASTNKGREAYKQKIDNVIKEVIKHG
jgi:cytochrome c biogenesis protein